LKVITWNLGYWQHRQMHEKAWDYLKEQLKPDLALLQEVNPIKKDNENLLFKKIHQTWGTAIYARNMPLEEMILESEYNDRLVAALVEHKQGKKSHTLCPSPLPSQVAALVEHKQGKKIAVVSVHAPIIGGRVFPHLEEIFQGIETMVCEKTFIVGGDLNTARLAEKVWPKHGHGIFFEKLERSIFFDCHHKFHEREEQTFFRKGSKYEFQDDHLFVSRDLADCVKSCHALNNEITRSVSDHIPIVAEIEML